MDHREYATPTCAEPRLWSPGPITYLAILGTGRPGAKGYLARLQALFGVGYAVQMGCRFQDRGFQLGGLEAFYWGRRQSEDFRPLPPEQWSWRLVTPVPAHVTRADVEAAVLQLRRKGQTTDTAKVKLQVLDEGQVVEVLHVGPYAAEGPSLAKLENLAAARGLRLCGLHHELYLDDPRKVAEPALRTILRRPVCPA
ncbi:MAG TPA: GyrI-like domain-containing protein [Myxococcota bacterium]|nr:GyrI-like domain-containing protein [Myxococcota bacterium]HRY92791.1 GyrI-like domain-containing protein [Myxococcota bacterium]HSA19833.1 GyrI-like domain-containing protein [Myxococcota bacterium]